MDRDERMKAVSLELDNLAHSSDVHMFHDGWNSARMRVFIATRLVSYQERCEELEEQLKFEKAVGERVVAVFKDAVGSEKSSS